MEGCWGSLMYKPESASVLIVLSASYDKVRCTNSIKLSRPIHYAKNPWTTEVS